MFPLFQEETSNVFPYKARSASVSCGLSGFFGGPRFLNSGRGGRTTQLLPMPVVSTVTSARNHNQGIPVTTFVPLRLPVPLRLRPTPGQRQSIVKTKSPPGSDSCPAGL